MPINLIELVFLVFVLIIVLPVSIYLCVKMGTAAFLITHRMYSQKKKDETYESTKS